YALCEEFSARNCIVYASARRLSALANLPASVHRIELDVLSAASSRAAVDQVIAEQGRIDVLVNNAGAGGTGALLDADVESDEGAKATVGPPLAVPRAPLFRSAACVVVEADTQRSPPSPQFEVNVWAPLRLSKIVVPHMVRQKSGLIVNVGSIVGELSYAPFRGLLTALIEMSAHRASARRTPSRDPGTIPTPWSGVYSASKAALHAFTEVLRMETEGFGLDIMLVAPGAIKSQFGQKQLATFKLPDDSLYKDVADEIAKRAEISQRQATDASHSYGPDHTTPAAVLARGVVSRALRSRPPAYYTVGGKSWVFWILERVPRTWVWAILGRAFGTWKVGKAKAGQAASKRTD
ncbi:SPOSA6832_01588, partial [Sporobolomyces salmonicolor]